MARAFPIAASPCSRPAAPTPSAISGAAPIPGRTPWRLFAGFSALRSISAYLKTTPARSRRLRPRFWTCSASPREPVSRTPCEAIEQRLEEGLTGEALRDEIVRALRSETRALRDEIRARFVRPRGTDDLTDDQALSAPGTSSEIRDLPGARPISVHRLQTAAGSGALDLDEAVKSYAYFRHEWLSRQGLVADRCSIIGVMGESMDPTLPEGCVILLDRNRRQRREGRIFVVRTEEGLVVKRAGKGTGGVWQLVSDHPRWPDAPWPTNAAIIGEVKWMAREL